ncbi:MAG: transcription elongation factor GreA [Bacteroidetes bacterium]|nr:transcription elongation factor GreA [Bacteroidota bacterium]
MGVMYLSEEGLSKLKCDLEKLTKVERPAISKQIAEARDKGDLSENAEYHAAKEAQGMLEMKISRLRESLVNSRLVDKNKIDTTSVQLMNKVKIKNKNNNQVMEYFLVAETEANLKEGKIAITSPIAKGLLGKKVGDVVDVRIPSGTIRFEIIGISL